jgi:hypothetical protein
VPASVRLGLGEVLLKGFTVIGVGSEIVLVRGVELVSVTVAENVYVDVPVTLGVVIVRLKTLGDASIAISLPAGAVKITFDPEVPTVQPSVVTPPPRSTNEYESPLQIQPAGIGIETDLTVLHPWLVTAQLISWLLLYAVTSGAAFNAKPFTSAVVVVAVCDW